MRIRCGTVLVYTTQVTYTHHKLHTSACSQTHTVTDNTLLLTPPYLLYVKCKGTFKTGIEMTTQRHREEETGFVERELVTRSADRLSEHGVCGGGARWVSCKVKYSINLQACGFN